MASCPLSSCGLFSVPQLKVHLQIKHHVDLKRDKIKCSQDQCNRVLVNWSSYQRHLKDIHSIRRNDSAAPCFEEARDYENDLMDLGDDSCPEESPQTFQTGPSIKDVKNHMHGIFLNYVAKMYSAPKLPRNLAQSMVSDVVVIFEEVLSQMQSYMQSGNIVSSEGSVALDLLREVISVFQTFNTDYRCLQFMNKSGCYIEPQPYVVGSQMVEKRESGRIVSALTPLIGRFVPMKRVLECFFSMPGVLKQVLDYVNLLENETGHILSNFVQGSLWRFKKNAFFQGKTVLPIFIYHDDFEINNPLGPHAVVQKLGGTYFSIPCLPPEQKSLLENIFLALLTYTSDIKSPDCNLLRNDAIFRKLVSQINLLQREGISLELKNEKIQLYFAFGLLLGDNEGLNNVQDYSAATSTCRFCHATFHDIRKDLVERPELLRCKGEYEEDVARGVKVSGIKAKSVWNEIDHHHIYDNFSVDILHDMDHGALKYGMYHVVNHYVNEARHKVLLSLLNKRLQTFNYYDNGLYNKPQLISERDLNESCRLNMTAAELRTFFLIFPILIFDLIKPDQDKVWDFYLVLRKIYDIISSLDIQENFVYILNSYVATHHEMYLKLFKDNLKPKHHNMVHYCTIIQKSGPLPFLSTYRWEARHKPNKERAVATNSRRDPPQTIAIKDQLKLCHRLLKGHGFQDRFEIGPSNLLTTDELKLLNVKSRLGVDFVETSWVDFKGTKYRPGMCVCYGTTKLHGLPKFGKIDTILCNENSEIVLVCEQFRTIGLHDKLAAYEVFQQSSLKAVRITDLAMFTPVVYAYFDGSHYMTLRHIL